MKWRLGQPGLLQDRERDEDAVPRYEQNRCNSRPATGEIGVAE
jgi:hypothetical protein